MLLALRLLFIVVILSMLGVTSWASLHTPLFALPREIYAHPWFLATLLDAYWAFVTFYVWVAWKEQSIAARLLWLLCILALGNFAMAAYMLRELFRIASIAELGTIFAQRNPGRVALPGALTAASLAVYALA
jgi:hypothetical protein